MVRDRAGRVVALEAEGAAMLVGAAEVGGAGDGGETGTCESQKTHVFYVMLQ